jgi:hypothetical protein
MGYFPSAAGAAGAAGGVGGGAVVVFGGSAAAKWKPSIMKSSGASVTEPTATRPRMPLSM